MWVAFFVLQRYIIQLMRVPYIYVIFYNNINHFTQSQSMVFASMFSNGFSYNIREAMQLLS
jgi:hypothetical protein